MVKWVPNPMVEEFLNENKVPYKYEPMVRFSDINIKKSQKNNARITTEPIINEVAERYAMAMREKSAVFPAGVLYRNGKGYIAADFNHRLEGFSRAGHASESATVGAYILETDDPLIIQLVTKSLNRLNGREQSDEEAVEQALAFMDQYPSVTQLEASRLFKVQASSVSKALQAKRAAETLSERRLNPAALTRGALCELGKLSHSEPAMAVCADIAIKNNLPVDSVKAMVAVVKEQKSDAKRIEVAEKFEDEVRRRSPKSCEAVRSPKVGFFRELHALFNRVAKFPTLEHLHITSKGEVDEAKRDWHSLKDRMEKLFK